ncbi:MAG: hypothetical protein C0402_05815 [Thermodesulfovibrio sp.]|nr:hypothetical protein [Thermodesulfovibrio sp.]
MSYILDALKKSEQERQRGTVPDLLTVQEEVLQTPVQRFRWQYVAAAAIVLGAGIAVWLLLPLKSSGPAGTAVIQEQLPASVVPVVSQEKVMQAPVPAFPMTEKRVEAMRVPVAGADKGKMDPEVLPELPPAGKTKTASVPAETGKPVAATQPPAQSPLQPLILPPADSGRIYRLKELPAALQKMLPSFSLSAFMYSSNPALRMVRINEQMMREGQELTAGIKLMEITADGVILSSHGYRFFIAMK